MEDRLISFQQHPHIDAALFEFVGEFTLDEYLDGMEVFRSMAEAEDWLKGG